MGHLDSNPTFGQNKGTMSNSTNFVNLTAHEVKVKLPGSTVTLHLDPQQTSETVSVEFEEGIVVTLKKGPTGEFEANTAFKGEADSNFTLIFPGGGDQGMPTYQTESLSPGAMVFYIYQPIGPEPMQIVGELETSFP